MALIEAIGLPDRPAVTHPAYWVFDHLALEASNPQEVDRWADWLRENGIDVVGPVDHKGLIYSIYFSDPNGLRMEITTPLDVEWNQHTEQGYADLKAWCDTKRAAIESGQDVGEALLALIRDQRRRYDED